MQHRLLAILFLLCTLTLTAQPLVLKGGRLIDGYGGPPLENAVVIIEGNTIKQVGVEGAIAIPDGARVIDTNGYTVMPGIMDMHVHLMIVGHGDYDHWDRTYPSQFRDVIMPIAAKQLLMAGVTTARDLGAPLEDIVAVKNRINAGEIPGPRMFVSGPFLQKSNTPLEEKFRWVVNGPEDARKKVRTIVAGGADVIKVIDQDQMTLEEVKAIVDEAHKAGKHVAAHAHRAEEIRQGLRAGVDCFEHTGLATKPGYDEDVLAMIRERNATLYWCPTMEGLFLHGETVRNPERLDDQRLKQDLPPAIYEDVRNSLRDPSHLEYFRLVSRRVPTLANKFRQLRESGVTIITGTDSGIPLNFHFDSTWRELKTMADLGMPPMEVIRAATYWPAQLLKQPNLGTIAPGKLADVIVVDGDPLADMSVLRHIVHVVKDGKVYTPSSEKRMTSHGSGTFEVKLTPLASADGEIARMSIDKQFHGDLEGTSKGEMIAVMTEVKGSAGYVEMERVSGTLASRTGTFALQHSGTMNRGEQHLDLTVVPDSGTGELQGIRGRMAIDIREGKHFYTFDYEL